jgi:hypothetical protein
MICNRTQCPAGPAAPRACHRGAKSLASQLGGGIEDGPQVYSRIACDKVDEV